MTKQAAASTKATPPPAPPVGPQPAFCSHSKEASTCADCILKASAPTKRQSTPPERRKICGYFVHPAAEILPEATPEEYARLKLDIKAHGLQVPIVLVEGLSGEEEILDGRTRARILEEEGEEYKGEFTTEFPDDPVALALSLNLERRHLRPDQVVAVLVLAEAVRANVGPKPKRSPKGTNRITQLVKTSGASRSTVKNVLAAQKADPKQVAEIVKGLTSANKVLRDQQAKDKAAEREREREHDARAIRDEKKEKAEKAALKKRAVCTECDCRHFDEHFDDDRDCTCALINGWKRCRQYSTEPPICTDCSHDHQRRTPCLTPGCDCLDDHRGPGNENVIPHEDHPDDNALPKVRRYAIRDAADAIREAGAELPKLDWFASRKILTVYPEVKPAFDVFFEAARKVYADLADALEKLSKEEKDDHR